MKRRLPTEYLFCFAYLVLAFSAVFLVLRGAWLMVATACLLIAAVSLLQWGLDTRCPACKRLGALRLLEKTPVHEESVSVTEPVVERVDAVRTNVYHENRVQGVRVVYEVTSECRFCGETCKHSTASVKTQF